MKKPEINDFSDRHVAGIIPLNSHPMDFNCPWPDCMQPVAPNFLAIERSVLECAIAGCKTIWVVCPAEIQPLLKSRVGEAVHDPVNYLQGKYKTKWPRTIYKQIPIYYIPIHPRDIDKRDSIVWSIIYGCFSVAKISRSFSKWLQPTRYYISFPNTIVPTWHVLKHRVAIATSRRFLMEYNGKTILDGESLSASLTNEDIKSINRSFREKASGMWDPESPKRNDIWPIRRLSLEKRYSGRFLTVKEVFDCLKPEDNTDILKVLYYWPIDSFEGYALYLGSESRKKVKRPVRKLLQTRSWNGIANSESEEE